MGKRGRRGFFCLAAYFCRYEIRNAEGGLCDIGRDLPAKGGIVERGGKMEMKCYVVDAFTDKVFLSLIHI